MSFHLDLNTLIEGGALACLVAATTSLIQLNVKIAVVIQELREHDRRIGKVEEHLELPKVRA